MNSGIRWSPPSPDRAPAPWRTTSRRLAGRPAPVALLAGLLLAGLILAAAAGPVRAWTGSEPATGAPVLTLAESLQLALEHSPRLGIARSRSRQSLAQVDQAESMLRPRLDAVASVSERKTPPEMLSPGFDFRTGLPTEPLTDLDSLTAGSVALVYSQVLFPLGQTRLQLEQARLAPAVARAQEAMDRAAVLADVESAYLGVLEARSGLELARLLERNAREGARVVREQAAAGMATELDVLAAENAAARAGQGRQAAEAGLEMAWDALFQTIGLPRPEQLPALEPVEYPPGEALLVGYDMESLQSRATTGRPELVMAAVQRDQARLRLEEARLQRRPGLALQASYQPADSARALTLSLNDRAAFQATVTHTESDVDVPAAESWQVGLQLTWNLLDGGATAAAIREAEEAAAQAELALRQLEAGIALELARKHSALTQAMLEVATTERAVAEAAGRYRRVQAQAESGAVARLQLWEAEAETARARHQHLQALAGLVRARTSLAIAAGFSSPELQQLIIASTTGGR